MVEWKGISGYSDFPEFEADLALFYSIPNPESAQGKRFLLLKYNCLWKLMFWKKTVNRSPWPQAPAVNELFEPYSTVYYVFLRANTFQTQAFN